MIGVERLERVLHVVAATGCVINGNGGISANLIAPSGGGKTELMLNALPPGSRVLNDVTTLTLTRLMRESPIPRYLVIPDLNITISHKPAVAELTMAMLLALTGEGISELNPGLQNEVKQRMKGQRAGLRIPVLTGMTPELFFAKRGKWRGTGLLRRWLPIYYKYSKHTERRIQDSIQHGQDAFAYGHREQPRVARRRVEIPSAQQFAIRQLSEDVTDQLVWRTRDKRSDSIREIRSNEYPFSAHKILRALAQASAALHHRAEVTSEDVDALHDIAKFMRYDRPEEV